ncbi:unnamed protein product [Vitrella brassicaformis CCMP3155]|uniref:Uncharacterized protein n=1 Tax=Vitrella brassicaformis (strain CCMP3155) TaxID=1169540 RepID=A0A0G4EWB3_VITBC|nr:unnamed protein product [Vitrella brassicaformis CCMP3155]|eukprot:CEM03247.1 unnamed protein product [Vitrella brassicaformis CCMP3155]
MPTPLTDSEDEKRAENIRNDEEDAFVSASTNRISPPDVAAYRKQTSQVAERVLLKLRCNRDPIVGRRQESGLVPDILFNPHDFPSGMKDHRHQCSSIESVTAIHGWHTTPKQDGMPFIPPLPQGAHELNKPWLDNGGMRGL